MGRPATAPSALWPKLDPASVVAGFGAVPLRYIFPMRAVGVEAAAAADCADRYLCGVLDDALRNDDASLSLCPCGAPRPPSG